MKVRNKKGKKIIKPAGSELMDYLNRGYAICNRCGAETIWSLRSMKEVASI